MTSTPNTTSESDAGPDQRNFVVQIIEADLKSGKHTSIRTRFPPEPNGFLHLGHAKSICLNFGLAKKFGGKCNLRFDDTNPSKEEQRYIDSIEADVKWLGFEWDGPTRHASDYFEQLYEWAVLLIEKGLAYVDDQTESEVRENRGNLKTPGKNSPYRDRTVAENLSLFEKMRKGEFPDGHCVLRAKIDMAHGNLNMRDPLLYRIKHTSHPRTGDAWCIYPIYDYTHGQSDSIENITHSICTLEFYDHRLLYDWFQDKLEITKTQQIEFARLNCTHTVMSKRKLLALVDEGHVKDWDDPRMPTISAMRRRGYPPEAIRDFCDRVGVAKRANVIPYSLLELCVREALTNKPRRFVIRQPIKVTLINWPDDKPTEIIKAANHPEDPSMGERELVFGRELFIESDDFMENPSSKFFRLSPNNEVRLRYAYWIKCVEVTKDEDEKVIELKCTYDPETQGGNAPTDGRKVKSTIHWLTPESSVQGEIRQYDRLFTVANPEEDQTDGKTWRDVLNPKSLIVCENAKIEKCLLDANVGDTYQFERLGYYVVDPDSTSTNKVFNLTVGLTDSFALAEATSAQSQTKEAARLAREQAAAEREEKKRKKAAKELAKLGHQ